MPTPGEGSAPGENQRDPPKPSPPSSSAGADHRQRDPAAFSASAGPPIWDEFPKIPVGRIWGDSGVCSPRATPAALNPPNRHGGAASTSAPLNPSKSPQIGKRPLGNLRRALCLCGEAKTARGGAQISQRGPRFRNSTHGGAKKPLWGRAGAAESGVGLEIVSEMQNQPKIPAGGGFWHRGDPSPSIADSLAGRRECRGEFRLGFRECGQNPTGNAAAAAAGAPGLRRGRLRAEEEPVGLGDGLGPRGASLSGLLSSNSIVSPIFGSLSPERGRDPPGAGPRPLLSPGFAAGPVPSSVAVLGLAGIAA